MGIGSVMGTVLVAMGNGKPHQLLFGRECLGNVVGMAAGICSVLGHWDTGLRALIRSGREGLRNVRDRQSSFQLWFARVHGVMSISCRYISSYCSFCFPSIAYVIPPFSGFIRHVFSATLSLPSSLGA